MSTNIYTLTINLPTADAYKISSIELNSFTYVNINDNYPIFIRETSLMASLSEVQFASNETFTTVGDYPNDAYLYVNNIIAFPCITNAENKRQCEIPTTTNKPHTTDPDTDTARKEYHRHNLGKSKPSTYKNKNTLQLNGVYPEM